MKAKEIVDALLPGWSEEPESDPEPELGLEDELLLLLVDGWGSASVGYTNDVSQ